MSRTCTGCQNRRRRSCSSDPARGESKSLATWFSEIDVVDFRTHQRNRARTQHALECQMCFIEFFRDYLLEKITLTRCFCGFYSRLPDRAADIEAEQVPGNCVAARLS